MSIKLLMVPLVAAIVASFIWAAAPGSAQGPGPTAGEQLATGLLSPRGIKMGPDGMLYVAEAGTGGDTDVNVEGADHNVGPSGRISKVDPSTGERSTVAEGSL